MEYIGYLFIVILVLGLALSSGRIGCIGAIIFLIITLIGMFS